MRLNFDEDGFVFQCVILADRMLNVLTGGTFQICLSTRAFIKAEVTTLNRWQYLKAAINWVFWEGHCQDSFEWECELKEAYVAKHLHLRRSVNK